MPKSVGKALGIPAEFPEIPKSAGKWSGCKIRRKILRNICGFS
jgi:hypothetical protein